MSSKEKIIQILKKHKSLGSAELVRSLKISRQKVTAHLKQLVSEGVLQKSGSTKAAVYSIPENPRQKSLAKQEAVVEIVKDLQGLKEDQVYENLEIRLGLKKLPKNVQSIAFYAFGEMLNNSIDHSKSAKATIQVILSEDKFKFTVRDTGIGLFANVKKTFHLKDEFEALEHILKGKQTTFPEQHSGQGIFFTSRIADIFIVRSHKIELTRDNLANDIRVKDIREIKGTEVYFEIKRRSKKLLKDLFEQFANEDYEFDRTQVIIRLTAERELLARSQAKRILMGLDQYKIIMLDFAKVKEIGQAFVDEVFRVYKNRHPEIQIVYQNANPAVEFMIQRGLKV